MRILYITTSYREFNDMATIRNERVVNGLLASGHSVLVLTASRRMRPFKEVINDSLSIYFTETPLFYVIQEKLVKSSVMSKIWNVIVGRILFPDTYMGWGLSCKPFLDNTRDNFDVVISSSGSYIAHMIAKNYVAKRSVKWIAYYGDPWSFNGAGKKKRFIPFLERRILRFCDKVILTTKETEHLYKSQLLNTNFHTTTSTLPCGFDRVVSNFNLLSSTKPFVMTYAGVSYSKDRNLGFLIKSIIETGRKDLSINFRLIGSYSKAYELIPGALDYVSFEGRVSYEESIRALYQSSILVHIGNFGNLQIPGKTYTYASIPVPILYLRQEVGYDPTAEFLSEFGGVIVCENSIESITNALVCMYRNYELLLKESKVRVMSESLKHYEWNQIAKRFSNIVEDVRG